jgi:hypothetical protein
MSAPAILEQACRDSADRAVLLYARSCPRCRWMARAILWLSAGRIKGVPLDVSEWRHFYTQELPESHGSPVLVRKARPYWGLRVFPLTLYVALQGACAAIGRRQR